MAERGEQDPSTRRRACQLSECKPIVPLREGTKLARLDEGCYVPKHTKAMDGRIRCRIDKSWKPTRFTQTVSWNGSSQYHLAQSCSGR
jgi:hypothetical protein